MYIADRANHRIRKVTPAGVISTVAGNGMFGATGFIIGPMIAALFLSLLDIYSAEHVDDLDRALPSSARAFVLPEEPPAQ